jgi:hypothetical protein
MAPVLMDGMSVYFTHLIANCLTRADQDHGSSSLSLFSCIRARYPAKSLIGDWCHTSAPCS